MVNSKMADLNDHLFAQLERLADEKLTPDQIDQEAKRGAAIVQLADRILEGADLQVQAAKIIAEFGIDPSERLPVNGPVPGRARIEKK